MTDSVPDLRPDHAFLTGGGELGRLIAAFDWAQTSLGPIGGWSESLKTSVSLALRSPVPIVMLFGEDGIMIYNDAYSGFAGGRHPQLLGSKVREGWPEVAAFNDNVMNVGLAGGTLAYRDQELTLWRNGVPEQVWMNLDYSPILDETGRPVGVIAIVNETTAKVKAERWLLGEQERLRQMFEQAPGFMALLTGSDHVFDLANAAYLQLVGYRKVLGMAVRDALPELAGQGFYELLDTVFHTGQAFTGTALQVYLQRSPGAEREERFVDLIYQPVRDPDGTVMGIFVQGSDVSDRVKAERAMRASEVQFRTFAQAMPNHVWSSRPDGHLDWFNQQVYAYSGASEGTLDGAGWARIVHPDDMDIAARRWRDSLASGAEYEVEFRLLRADGLYRWHLGRAVPIRSPEGAIVSWVGTNTDIEDQKMTAQALAHLNANLEARVEQEIADRRNAELALVQAQKMEAIGNLTGGVAHDFNNLLQVISGNLQLLRKDVAGNERAERRVTNAMAGVSRGARLASQLLAFGRRQPLEPKVINVGRFVAGMDDMLRRSLGEAVEIETIVSGGLWNTFADPAQIENALLNLAINARDAMDGGGKLTIEVGNAFIDELYARSNPDSRPGQFVMLAVSDTGSGIKPELIEKVFEPFFTTKPEGKGTGLGLSMVYGFVRQSGGHARIYSEVGLGTTVKLYLPRATQDEDAIVPVGEGPVTGGTETILVAEDDDEVRGTVVELLTELGYRVLTARDAQSALTVLESGAAPDLLFTDVVMPGTLKSPELARKARERDPHIAVLFTSGYTENSIVHEGRLDAGVELLSKPYTREALARRVRHVLANRAQRRAAVATPQPAPAPDGESGLTVLLVEDDFLIREFAAEMLRELGTVVLEAASGEAALDMLEANAVDVLITDIGLPGMDGEELRHKASALRPGLKTIVASGASPRERPGIITLSKPYVLKDIKAALTRVMED